jgi:hypothetical protein
MNSHPKLKTILQAILAVLVLVTVLPAWRVSGSSDRHPKAGFLQADPPTTTYLPFVMRNYPRHPTIFGVEMLSLTARKIDTAKAAKVSWVRYFTFSWASIEPARTATPSYNWSTVDEQGLINAAANNLEVVATVKFTPSWAQKYPGVSCGPMAASYFDEFAQFMSNLVARYSVPPYNVRYWEIGNEVDVDPDLVSPDHIFGCWGDEDNYYYGGGYFGDMLSYVYPAMKAVDSTVTVLIGGLLLDCDPTNPPPGLTCKSSRFLEGILRNGGGNYFDVVSFHTYPLYNQGQIIEIAPRWGARGGVLMGKISFLREVMANYGVNKPLMITEASLVCPTWSSECNPVSNGFLEAQADYVTWLYLRGWAENIMGVVWYTLEDSDWQSSGLFSSNVPKPAYYAYQFSATELEDATMVGPLSQYPGLMGYEFRAPGKRIWVLWSPSRTNSVITLPGGILNVFDKYGVPSTPIPSQITVNSPVYIEISP